MPSKKFVVKTDIPPEKFEATMNTQDGLGYELETMIPNHEHTAYALIFRRREQSLPGMPANFEELLAQASGAPQGLGGDLSGAVPEDVDISDLLGKAGDAEPGNI